MDVSRLRQGERIAAGSAIALILIMFIFDWFGVKFSGSTAAGVFGAEGSRNAWGSFSVIDLILFVTVVAALAMAYFSGSGQSVSLPIALSAIVAGLGILSVLLILFRLISPPDLGLPSAAFDQGLSHTRKIGAFLGLIAAAGVAYGGYMAMQEEGTSFSDTRDRLQDRMGPSDPGGGSPPPPSSGGGAPPPPSSGGTPPSAGGTPPSA
jgi:hypothetical protein